MEKWSNSSKHLQTQNLDGRELSTTSPGSLISPTNEEAAATLWTTNRAGPRDYINT
jgi:hypothetical protein